MKSKIYFIALVLIGAMFYSCDSDDLAYQNKFETSKKEYPPHELRLVK
ncbi:hypothetical protein [Salegentibacter sp. F14]